MGSIRRYADADADHRAAPGDDGDCRTCGLAAERGDGRHGVASAPRGHWSACGPDCDDENCRTL